MHDEFIQFAQDGFHISSEGHEIQLWGTRDNGSVDLKGVSLHWPDRWEYFNPDGSRDPPSTRLQCAYNVADSAGVPLIWIGEPLADWRELNGKAEIGEITRTGGSFSASTHFISLDTLEQELQNIMNTSLSAGTTKKEINRAITPVQHWVRNNMPPQYSVIDIDILVGDSDGKPLGQVEIKRANYPGSVQGWWPFYEDRRNYYTLIDSCERSGTEPILIQHQMDSIDSDSTVAYYDGLSENSHSTAFSDPPDESDARGWLDFNVEYPDANEAKEKLLNL